MRVARLLGIVAAACLTEAPLIAETPVELLRAAELQAREGNSAAAVKLLTQALEDDPQLAAAYYLRGRESFRVGKVEQSVRDFDRYVELRPEVASRQWERGIALYYAGKYQQGAEQFELYQSYHNSDVENSVWRFLCMVSDVGVEKARAAMLPIQDDRRVPMMEIFRLFRDQVQPEEVLAAVQRGDAEPEHRAAHRFYADLYLALYFDALGKSDQAREHIGRAAAAGLKRNPFLNRYMWDVARIHKQKHTRETPEESKSP